MIHFQFKRADTDEPAPIDTEESKIVLNEVRKDLEARAQTGLERYGTYLKSHNGRDALMDLYQELLDACMYVKQAIMERDSK